MQHFQCQKVSKQQSSAGVTSSPWFGSVQPGPNYWRSWTSSSPFMAGPYYHCSHHKIL